MAASGAHRVLARRAYVHDLRGLSLPVPCWRDGADQEAEAPARAPVQDLPRFRLTLSSRFPSREAVRQLLHRASRLHHQQQVLLLPPPPKGSPPASRVQVGASRAMRRAVAMVLAVASAGLALVPSHVHALRLPMAHPAVTARTRGLVRDRRRHRVGMSSDAVWDRRSMYDAGERGLGQEAVVAAAAAAAVAEPAAKILPPSSHRLHRHHPHHRPSSPTNACERLGDLTAQARRGAASRPACSACSCCRRRR